MARAAGDVPFGGYVLVCAGLQASLRGFHDDAIDMCQGAVERAKSTATPRVLAFSKLIEARAHARAGDGRAADYARDLTDRLQPWMREPGVVDLGHRLRHELAVA